MLRLLSAVITLYLIGQALAIPQIITTLPPFKTVTDTLTAATSTGTSLAVPSPRAVHPNGNTSKCLTVANPNNLFNGVLVVLGECTSANVWSFSDGDTLFRYATTGFCLDASTASPANGVALKLWECFDLNLAAQHWFYTADKRIALQSGSCVDNSNGALTDGNQIQAWKCTDNDTFQVWTT